MTDQQPDPGTYEGEEGILPSPAPPQRYQPQPQPPPPPHSASPVPAPPPSAVPAPAASGPSTADRLVAVSGPLSFVLFMVCGFLGGWAWSWIFFMLPGILYAWNRAERKH